MCLVTATVVSGCSSWNIFGSSPPQQTQQLSATTSSQTAWIVDSATNCATTNPFAQDGEFIRWFGRCRSGKLDGYGTLIWYRYGVETERNEGTFAGGALNGTVVTTYANGNIIYGQYNRGRRNGLFVVVDRSGGHIWATYENNKLVKRAQLTRTAFNQWRSQLSASRAATALHKSLVYFYGTNRVDNLQTATKAPIQQQPVRPLASTSSALKLPTFNGPPGHQPIQPLRSAQAYLTTPHGQSWQYQPAAYNPSSPAPVLPDQDYRVAADGLFARAYKYERSGQIRKAWRLYDELLLTYPSAPVALLANNRLVELKGYELANQTASNGEPQRAGSGYVTTVNSPVPVPNGGLGAKEKSRTLKLLPTSDDVARSACSRDGLYESNSKWCGVVVSDDGDYYKVRVNDVTLRGFGTIGIDRSVCTGNTFLTWFSRGTLVRVPKACVFVRRG